MFDLESLISTVSYLGIFAIIFAETGLLLGFFLPGDSLLISAGLMAAKGSLSLPLLVAITVFAAISGNLTGYFIGRKFGPLIFEREKSRFFHPEHVEKTHRFFDKHGSKTIILARFIPIIRTFVATFAGVSKMSFRRFMLFSIIGGLLWGLGLPVAAFYLGKMIPDLDKYILLVIAVVIVVSFIPVFVELYKNRKRQSLKSEPDSQ